MFLAFVMSSLYGKQTLKTLAEGSKKGQILKMN